MSVRNLNYGIVASSEGFVNCVFCSETITNANSSIEEHVNGFQHKGCKKILRNMGIIYRTRRGLHCENCKKSIKDKEEALDHLNSCEEGVDMLEDEEPDYYDCPYCGETVQVDYYALHALEQCTSENVLGKVLKTPTDANEPEDMEDSFMEMFKQSFQVMASILKNKHK